MRLFPSHVAGGAKGAYFKAFQFPLLSVKTESCYDEFNYAASNFVQKKHSTLGVMK